MNNIVKVLRVSCITLVGFLAACGGGGSSSPQTKPLSATQKNYLTSTLTSTYHGFAWNIPLTQADTPTDGRNYFVASSFAIPASPETGKQRVTVGIENLTTTLSPPSGDKTARFVLKNGAIFEYQIDSRTDVYFEGDSVRVDAYATNGTTLLGTSEFDDWSESIPLTGSIAESDILKRFYGFARVNVPSYFDKTVEWKAGASYITRKRKLITETIQLIDWFRGDTDLDPWSGSQTTIESMFNYVESNFGGISIEGVTYTLADGNIETKEGVRMWIASEKLPASESPSGANVVFLELDNKIYYAHFLPAMTREKFVDGVDRTVINDFSIRFNSVAVQTIKEAVKF